MTDLAIVLRTCQEPISGHEEQAVADQRPDDTDADVFTHAEQPPGLLHREPQAVHLFELCAYAAEELVA